MMNPYLGCFLIAGLVACAIGLVVKEMRRPR